MISVPWVDKLQKTLHLNFAYKLQVNNHNLSKEEEFLQNAFSNPKPHTKI